MAETLTLEAEGVQVAVALERESAPHTIEAMLACLPARIDLHCAKVAGDQLLFSLPVVMPGENPRNIQESGPGLFMYYPNRQFFEIMFGDLADEEAYVTTLGKVIGDLGGVRRIGDAVQREQGWRIVWGSLSSDADSQPVANAIADTSPAVQELRAAREAMWTAPPSEVTLMMARRGMMTPLGPLVFAESEARKLQENLWALRERAAPKEGQPPPSEHDVGSFVADAGSMLLDAGGKLLSGYSSLHETGAFLCRAAKTLAANPAAAPALLDEAILYVGRLAWWLDLHFPWQRLNDVAAEAADALAREEDMQ